MPTSSADKLEARAAWHRWRNILTAVTSHAGYKYGDPRLRVLLRLADHAMKELGRFNTLVWR